MIELSAGQKAMVEDWVEKLEGNPPEKRPDDPHGVAMEQFKRLYEVRDGEYVRREKKTQEAFKTVAGKKRPASDFLVVPDKEKPGEWSLPVKVNGKVDHKMMGEAWVVLHGGGGPDKALSKLKALYKRENMPVPTEESMEDNLKEMSTPGSVDDYLNRVRGAFDQQFNPSRSDMQVTPNKYWVYETFVDHSVLGTSLVIERGS